MIKEECILLDTALKANKSEDFKWPLYGHVKRKSLPSCDEVASQTGHHTRYPLYTTHGPLSLSGRNGEEEKCLFQDVEPQL